MKPIPAILASLAITAVIAIGMLVIGANALLNPNTLPIVNAASSDPAAANAAPVQVSDPSSASTTMATLERQVSQLKDLVAQYQNREKQYQTQLTDAASQLNQANQQIQSYQQLLTVLQQRGIIRITQDGQIMLPRGLGGLGDN